MQNAKGILRRRRTRLLVDAQNLNVRSRWTQKLFCGGGPGDPHVLNLYMTMDAKSICVLCPEDPLVLKMDAKIICVLCPEDPLVLKMDAKTILIGSYDDAKCLELRSQDSLALD